MKTYLSPKYDQDWIERYNSYYRKESTVQHKPKKTHTTKMDPLSATSHPKPTAAVDSVIYSIIDNALNAVFVELLMIRLWIPAPVSV